MMEIQAPLVESGLRLPLLLAEINRALKTMKESALGRDEVTVSMIKHLPEVGRQPLHHLSRRVWEHPIDNNLWTANVHSSVLWCSSRKGDNHEPTNYTAISLLCICWRVRTMELNIRVKAGTINGVRACLDVIFTIRLVIARRRNSGDTFHPEEEKQGLQLQELPFLFSRWTALQDSRIVLTAIDVQKAYTDKVIVTLGHRCASYHHRQDASRRHEVLSSQPHRQYQIIWAWVRSATRMSKIHQCSHTSATQWCPTWLKEWWKDQYAGDRHFVPNHTPWPLMVGGHRRRY